MNQHGVRVRGVLPKRLPFKEGVLIADGTEQVVIEVEGLVNIEGYVDLSQMQNGDSVTLRRYVKIEADGVYRLHGEETYFGAQPQPLVRFPPITGSYGIKVTLHQTSGTFKAFPYQFFKEM